MTRESIVLTLAITVFNSVTAVHVLDEDRVGCRLHYGLEDGLAIWHRTRSVIPGPRTMMARRGRAWRLR